MTIMFNPQIKKFMADQKDKLKDLSSKRAAQWPNTLANLRILREKTRQDHLAQEEVMS